MIRKILIFIVLVVTAVAAIVFPLSNSDAAHQQPSGGSQQGSARRALPNFDVRLFGRGEFNDMELNSTAGAQAAMQNARRRSRASAVGQFRSTLATEKAANLRAIVNEAGAMKNFFIDGATLSEPRSDTADNVARNFLQRHNSLFALSGAGIEELKLENEDNDQGTTFLSYTQTVGGLKVFEGHVQVVLTIMSTHVSATALEETPHETETTQITISDTLRRLAQSVIDDRRTDPQWRTIIRYALKTNDPWLADIVRRASAGEKIIDSTDFTLEPRLNEDDSHEGRSRHWQNNLPD